MIHRTALRGLSVLCAWIALGTLLSACGTGLGPDDEYDQMEQRLLEGQSQQMPTDVALEIFSSLPYVAFAPVKRMITIAVSSA